MSKKVVLLVCKAGRYQDSLAAALKSSQEVGRVWILEQWVKAPIEERLAFPDILLFEYPQPSERMEVIALLRYLFPEMRCLPLIEADQRHAALELQGVGRPLIKGFSVEQLFHELTGVIIHSMAPSRKEGMDRPSSQ